MQFWFYLLCYILTLPLPLQFVLQIYNIIDNNKIKRYLVYILTTN
jgi:hypothetical protein